jgi:hypothetical protein
MEWQVDVAVVVTVAVSVTVFVRILELGVEACMATESKAVTKTNASATNAIDNFATE